MPFTLSEKSDIALPKVTIFSLKSSKSTSPVNQLTTPPLFGKVDAIFAMASPALAAAVTASLSIFPETTLENSVIASPNGTMLA